MQVVKSLETGLILIQIGAYPHPLRKSMERSEGQAYDLQTSPCDAP